MKTPVYNLDGKAIGDIDLPDAIFSAPWKPILVRQALHVQIANQRKPLAHARTRGEVSGGGVKPWRQKGTGRARHGSIRSPIWRGGGVTHGPTNEQSFTLKMNKKERRAAILALLSKKVKDEELKIISSFDDLTPKTKSLSVALGNLVGKEKAKKGFSSLIIPAKHNQTVYRASANLQKVKAINFSSVSVHDLMKYTHILLDKNVIEELVS